MRTCTSRTSERPRATIRRRQPVRPNASLLEILHKRGRHLGELARRSVAFHRRTGGELDSGLDQVFRMSQVNEGPGISVCRTWRPPRHRHEFWRPSIARLCTLGASGRLVLPVDSGLLSRSRDGDVLPQTSTERSLAASKLRNRAAIRAELQLVMPVAKLLATRIDAHNVLKIRRTVLHVF